MDNPLEVGSSGPTGSGGGDMVIFTPKFNRELNNRRIFAMFVIDRGIFNNFGPIQGFSLTRSPNRATEYALWIALAASEK